jgi:hypothetical protein
LFFVASIAASFLGSASAAEPTAAPPVATPPAPTAAAVAKAAQYVQRALAAEAADDAPARNDLLERALLLDPTCAAAHWHSGHVRVKDRWLTADEAAKEMTASGKVDEYRRKAATAPRSAKEQLTLADWCAAEGLDLQARMHRMAALEIDPTSRAVIAKLKLVNYQGKLIPGETLNQVKQQQKDYANAARKWTQPLTKLQMEFKAEKYGAHKAAREKLLKLVDPSAIPTMEALSAKAGSPFADAVVEALAAMPEQEATDALVRQAVYSPYEEARDSASQALKTRSLFGYVPTLMSILQAPIEIQSEQTFGFDQSFHRLTLFQEGPLASQAFVSAGGYSRNITLHMHPRRGTSDVTGNIHPDLTLDEDRTLAQKAEEFNAAVATTNANTLAALSTATGQKLGDKPADWWKWWLDYNEIYQYPEKPVVVTARDYAPRQQSRYRVTYSSCFVAGTKVWTMTGPLSIERVQVGDCVLSQDPTSGELAYKPVLATTLRPASPVREIKIGDDSISATRGHPFWVSGVGWRMAKELKAGDPLHTAAGPVEITSIDEGRDAICFNLVVADFGTYFVGEQKLLVHDNTLRDVTPAVVPGLIVK